MITLTVTGHFAAAHFYHQKKWSEERNRAEFGRCFSPYGHGHNYRVEAVFRAAEPSPSRGAASGHLTSLAGPSSEALRAVIDPLDHAHLNFVIPEFADTVPTTENIARWIWDRLALAGHDLLRVRLFETDDLWVEIQR